ncbi:hypothetical protein [Actinophytocola sp.]|uniref:hypothetical protein n=1 Tax=Actinophytocola sp. TaxID=1872138 RepID=UPI00389A14A4
MLDYREVVVGKLIKPLTPHEIYEKLRAGDTRLLEEGRAAAQAQAVAEGARALLLGKQAALLQSGWEGSAGAGASGVVKSLVDNAHAGTDQLAEAQKLMDRQSSSFHHAANSVRPVPAGPPKQDLTDPMWPFVDYERQVMSYQSDAQHNIDVFRGYDTASESYESGMRPYTIVDDSGETVTVGDTGDYIEVPDDGSPRDGGQPRDGGPSEPLGGRRDPGSGRGPGPGSGFGPGSSFGPGPGSGFGPGGVPVGGVQETSPSDFGPRPGWSPGPVPGGPGPGGQVAGGPGPGGSPGQAPFMPGGFTTGGVTYGPGAGPGTGGPGTTGRDPALRGGTTGAGPLTAEEAAAQRTATAATRRPGPGMMGTPTAPTRGKDNEDEEHHRKILIEADPESLFGSDELTAPQVIGDDDYEDD